MPCWAICGPRVFPGVECSWNNAVFYSVEADLKPCKILVFYFSIVLHCVAYYADHPRKWIPVELTTHNSCSEWPQKKTGCSPQHSSWKKNLLDVWYAVSLAMHCRWNVFLRISLEWPCPAALSCCCNWNRDTRNISGMAFSVWQSLQCTARGCRSR